MTYTSNYRNGLTPEIIPGLFIIIIIIIGIVLWNKRKHKQQQRTENTEHTPEYQQYSYEPKWMFSMNEKNIFYELEKIVKEENLRIFAKVRLLDLVTPVRNHPQYKTNLYKIQAKHVDFVITKQNLVAKYIIELDDASHDTKSRKERDDFVDAVLQACGYKVLHIRGIQEEVIRAFLHGQDLDA